MTVQPLPPGYPVRREYLEWQTSTPALFEWITEAEDATGRPCDSVLRRQDGAVRIAFGDAWLEHKPAHEYAHPYWIAHCAFSEFHSGDTAAEAWMRARRKP
jgi:hypothetical protein